MSRGICTSDPAVVASLTEACDEDGWRKPRDMRDEMIEQLRNELSVERLWAERGWTRVKLLETQLAAIREVIR